MTCYSSVMTWSGVGNDSCEVQHKAQGGLLAVSPNRAQAATTCLPLIACLYSSASMCLQYLGTLCRAPGKQVCSDIMYAS